ncbi:MAG TPA: archaeosortase/exosortase family protein [Chitinophagaceae bacterium]
MSYKDIIQNPGFKFILRFLVFFLGLHYGNELFIGLTAPGGLYVPFLESHLNYVAWIRQSVLYGAKLLSNLMGYPAYIDGPYHLRSVTGPGVQMVYSCIGLGIMSFWAGFVLAHALPWKKKLAWTLAGLVTIWIINCFRVAIILAATVNRWNINRFMDHHDFFNMVAYVFIFILIIVFLRRQGLHKSKIAAEEPVVQ